MVPHTTYFLTPFISLCMHIHSSIVKWQNIHFLRFQVPPRGLLIIWTVIENYVDFFPSFLSLSFPSMSLLKFFINLSYVCMLTFLMVWMEKAVGGWYYWWSKGKSSPWNKIDGKVGREGQVRKGLWRWGKSFMEWRMDSQQKDTIVLGYHREDGSILSRFERSNMAVEKIRAWKITLAAQRE